MRRRILLFISVTLLAIAARLVRMEVRWLGQAEGDGGPRSER